MMTWFICFWAQDETEYHWREHVDQQNCSPTQGQEETIELEGACKEK